ncbi:MAG TPA: YsnF/AvaK domain-containing protein, partial [Niastella sp.]|nr:YsnF/AvaK domain-containing protein [Niastella sp.]
KEAYMAQTVIGFFDDATAAQNAVQQLVSNGFDRDRIDVSSGNNRGALSTSSTSSDRTDNESENGITRFFKNLFGDNDEEANRYSRVGMQSNSIVTVHAQSSDEAERAADLLDDFGAVNVNEKASAYETSGSDYDRTSDSLDTDNLRSDVSRDTDRDTTINRIEENLEVGKRTVETGGVRVRSRIVEKPVEENIRLREERVTVERNPVDRVANRDELSNFEERDIELTERAEVPVVNKEARVVEEIRVSKDVNEREETVRDTVRRTEVDVDNLDKSDKTRGISNFDNTGNIPNLDTDYDDDSRTRNNRI